jgi:hypothetical protein
MSVNVMDILSSLLSFGIFSGHLFYFMVILVHIFPGMLYQEISGNPDSEESIYCECLALNLVSDFFVRRPFLNSIPLFVFA